MVFDVKYIIEGEDGELNGTISINSDKYKGDMLKQEGRIVDAFYNYITRCTVREVNSFNPGLIAPGSELSVVSIHFC